MLSGNKNYIIKSSAVQALWHVGITANGRREHKKPHMQKAYAAMQRGLFFYQPQPSSPESSVPATLSRALRMFTT